MQMAGLGRVVAGLAHISAMAGAVRWLLAMILDGRRSKHSRKQSTIMAASWSMLKIVKRPGSVQDIPSSAAACIFGQSSSTPENEHGLCTNSVPFTMFFILPALLGMAGLGTGSPLLGLLGFGAGGIIAGSLAAAYQSMFGPVVAGSAFALMQSAGAGGGGSLLSSLFWFL